MLETVLHVLRGCAACAPWLAVDAAAAGRTAPVVVGMRCVNRLGGAAGEEEGPWLHKQEATNPTAPKHLAEES